MEAAFLVRCSEAFSDCAEGVIDLIDRLPDGAYARVSGVHDSKTASPIGHHVRHCVDFVEALMQGITTGVVQYFVRNRGTDLETNPKAGVAALRKAITQVGSLPVTISGDTPIMVEDYVSAAGSICAVKSTLEREAMFIVGHFVHHQAYIGLLAQAYGVQLTPFFGFASTTTRDLSTTRAISGEPVTG